MIGPVICAHRLLGRLRRRRSGSSSITRSTFSTTTIASSTTMPIASTIASSETVLAEKPERQQHREGADQADRHGDDRDDGGAQVAEEQEDHEHHQHEGLDQRLHHLVDRVGDEGGAVVEDLRLHARRESAADSSSSAALHARRGLHRVGARREIDADRDRRLAVQPALGVHVRAPSSTRATSRTRSTEPSGLARITMSPNCSGVVSRPCVCTLSWNCWSSAIGRAPMRPTARLHVLRLDRRDDVATASGSG